MEPVATVSLLTQLLEAGKALYMNYAEVLAHVSAVCSILIVVFLPIKGEQPEKFLTAVVNFIAKFSKK